MSDWTLCIDFGTAYSKAAVAPTGAWSSFDPSRVRPLMLGAHDPRGDPFLLQSVVFVDEESVRFGRAAAERAEELSGAGRVALRSFKTLLSVGDLDRGLNTSAPKSIDPKRQFKMRDLIVLYLAYLLAAIERAKAADPLLAETKPALRYAAPDWSGGESASMHAVVTRLFAGADAFRLAAGDQLLAPEGLAISAIKEALPKAFSDAPPLAMALIFEATAAAAYTSIGLDSNATHLIVVDVGAGTTDITALARSSGRMSELAQARETLKQAGDFIDRVIANRIVALDGRARTVEKQTELWRALMHEVRDVKETLCATGKVTFRHQGRALTLSLRDLERDADFRAFIAAMTKAYDRGLATACGAAGKKGEVLAVAVGGGASAPFVQALLRRKPSGANARVAPRPAVPDWAHAPEFQGNLAPVFSQLAIAIGGALAPDDMLAAR